jgi:hypothetical protein
MVKAAHAAPLACFPRQALLGEARLAQAGPQPQGKQLKMAHTSRGPVPRTAVFLASDFPSRGCRVNAACGVAARSLREH